MEWRQRPRACENKEWEGGAKSKTQFFFPHRKTENAGPISHELTYLLAKCVLRQLGVAIHAPHVGRVALFVQLCVEKGEEGETNKQQNAPTHSTALSHSTQLTRTKNTYVIQEMNHDRNRVTAPAPQPSAAITAGNAKTPAPTVLVKL